MATHLEIVNKVLLRLREDAVTSIDETAYSQLIGEFVSDIHREVSEEWPWPSTIKTVQFQTVANQTGYALDATTSGGGAVLVGSNITTERSALRVRADGYPDIHISEDSSFTNSKQVTLLADEQRHLLANTVGDATADFPTHASVRLGTTNAWTLQFWPKPVASDYYVNTIWSVPEEDLEVDGSTDGTEIYIPNRPIYLGALWLAFNERGEEIGEPGGIAETRYMKSLAAERERAFVHEQSTGRFDWYRG